jgi:hypothetical protein
MKLTALRLSIAASVMLAAVTTASAQNMKAEIPFDFQAAGARMLAGSYEIKSQYTPGGAPMVQIRNVDNRRSVMALPFAQDVLATPGNEAKLTFLCAEGRCELSGLRTHEAKYGFRTGKPGPETRIATVVLRPDRTE